MSTFDNDQLFYMNSRGIEKSKEIFSVLISFIKLCFCDNFLRLLQNINHVQELFSSI